MLRLQEKENRWTIGNCVGIWVVVVQHAGGARVSIARRLGHWEIPIRPLR